MQKIKKALIIIICAAVAILGLAKLGSYIFDKSTSIKGIKEVQVSLLDYDGEGYYVIGDWKAIFDTPEMIAKVRKAGKEISEYNDSKYDGMEGEIHIKFTYSCKFGIKITRFYHLSHNNLGKLKKLKKLYESREFKEKFLITNNDKIMKDGKYVGRGVFLNEFDKILKDPEELIKNMDRDFMERTYENQIPEDDLLDNYKIIGSISVADQTTIAIYGTDKHTLKWLEDNGYMDKLE